jgi:ubiquinone/menaquinone biosynthesis C-methylase UbiE
MSFDRIASTYDQIALLVFGKAIIDSQIVYFDRIQNSDRILVIGGGTGWILKNFNIPGTEIDYLEASGKMINKAKQQNTKIKVNFIHQPFEEVVLSGKYDVIISNFFLDLYPGKEMLPIIKKLDRILVEGGLLFVTDFRNNLVWQSIMLSIMYLFFQITTDLKTSNLGPLWEDLNSNFHLVKSKKFYAGFIDSRIYQKYN